MRFFFLLICLVPLVSFAFSSATESNIEKAVTATINQIDPYSGIASVAPQMNSISVGATGLSATYAISLGNSHGRDDKFLGVSSSYSRVILPMTQIQSEISFTMVDKNDALPELTYRSTVFSYLIGPIFSWGDTDLKKCFFTGMMGGLNQSRLKSHASKVAEYHTFFNFAAIIGKRFSVNNYLTWSPSVAYMGVASGDNRGQLAFNILALAVWF